MKIGIINYGMGNLASIRRALEEIGGHVVVAAHPAELLEVSHIVLPGVGAFGEGMRRLSDAGWVDALQDVAARQHKPILGICLGMQMLATLGNEGGLTRGIGLIPGKVQRLDTLGCRLRIPHVGWNEVRYKTSDVLLEQIPDSSDFYFVHSYGFVPEKEEHLIATVPYDLDVAAVVRSNSVFGCQFHPEKSSRAGRRLLMNFVGYSSC